MFQILAANNIGEVFVGNICPYCGKEEDIKDNKTPVKAGGKASNGPWLDHHLKRCKKKKEHLDASDKLKGTADKPRPQYVLHPECGRVFLLQLQDGLALVENNARRYVVPAGSLSAGHVASIIEIIRSWDLQPDEIRELISHLLAEAKDIDVRPALGRGNQIEFMHQDRVRLGTVDRKVGKRLIVRFKDGGGQEITLNIANEDVMRIIE